MNRKGRDELSTGDKGDREGPCELHLLSKAFLLELWSRQTFQKVLGPGK